MGGFGTIRGGSGGTAAGVGSAPNQIPGLLVWVCAGDRVGGPVIVRSGDVSYPVDFNTYQLLNRAVYMNTGSGIGNGYGTAQLMPNWGGACVDTFPALIPAASLFLACNVGVDRFQASGFTYLNLWFSLQDILPLTQFKLQMGYRVATGVVTEILGPTIITWNPTGGPGTGFAGAVPTDAGAVTTQVFPIVWGTGWYIVGLDGRAGGNLKLRVNGVNGAPQALNTLFRTPADKIVWGSAGQLQLLEGCVWDRPLADAEYAAVERHWIAKYDNIQLGRVGAPGAGEALSL